MKIKAPRSGEMYGPPAPAQNEMYGPPAPAQKKHTEESFRPAPSPGEDLRKSVHQLLQHAFQPAPPPKPKVSEKSAFASFASFASKLKDASKLAQAAFQAAPAPSSGGWSPVSINSNGTFTLPLIGTDRKSVV